MKQQTVWFNSMFAKTCYSTLCSITGKDGIFFSLHVKNSTPTVIITDVTDFWMASELCFCCLSVARAKHIFQSPNWIAVAEIHSSHEIIWMWILFSFSCLQFGQPMSLPATAAGLYLKVKSTLLYGFMCDSTNKRHTNISSTKRFKDRRTGGLPLVLLVNNLWLLCTLGELSGKDNSQ